MDRELILELERAGLRAMPPAETVRFGEWLAAIGRGSVSRLNSCSALGDSPRRAMFERIEQVERRYARRGRETVFRLTGLDTHLDGRLQTRGYERSDEVLVMVAPADGTPDPAVTIASAPGPTWTSRFRAWSGRDDVGADEIIESLGSIRLDVGVFHSDHAVGAAVRDGDLVGLFDIAVDPGARRSGHGMAISEAMVAWGAAQGAARAYLQVLATNEPAVALYRSLGFTDSHRYWYRRLTAAP